MTKNGYFLFGNLYCHINDLFFRLCLEHASERIDRDLLFPIMPIQKVHQILFVKLDVEPILMVCGIGPAMKGSDVQNWMKLYQELGYHPMKTWVFRKLTAEFVPTQHQEKTVQKDMKEQFIM